MISLHSISALDQEGRGIAHRDGKALFIENALPGERVDFEPRRIKPTYEFGIATAVQHVSPYRVTPRCRYFGVCGGCSLQHIDADAQVAFKQRILEEQLERIGRVHAERILSPVYGPAWRYRHRARFSVRFVAKKGGVLIGFHEKRSTYVADMESCEILPERVSALIGPLRELISALSIKARIPQIEVALGEACLVLLIRNLEPLTRADEALLQAFAERHAVSLYLQPHGPKSIHPLFPKQPAPLAYTVPEFDIVMPFDPTEFTQVNPAINRVLVRKAVELLEPRPEQRILDLFCGLGNFSLPLARRGAHVVGIEGEQALVARARQNAQLNGVEERTAFEQRDLFQVDVAAMNALGAFDKWLIDPPRDGAIEVVKSMPAQPPRRIVYISCNPATLARDAAVLVHTQGYALSAAGILNMFPHTSHVESIAVFDLER